MPRWVCPGWGGDVPRFQACWFRSNFLGFSKVDLVNAERKRGEREMRGCLRAGWWGGCQPQQGQRWWAQAVGVRCGGGVRRGASARGRKCVSKVGAQGSPIRGGRGSPAMGSWHHPPKLPFSLVLVPCNRTRPAGLSWEPLGEAAGLGGKCLGRVL